MADITLKPDDFEIDEEGRLRIKLEKAQELLEVLKTIAPSPKTPSDSIPPKPRVKVEL